MNNRGFDESAIVKGVTIDDRGADWQIEASQRSIYTIFLVPFTIMWVGSSLFGVDGSQLLNNEFSIERTLFELPFLIASIVLTVITLISLFGRTVVNVQNGETLIFIGIGSIGWYRRFDWSSIDRVTENIGYNYKHISLEGSRRINLGWGLSSEKLYCVKSFLQSKIATDIKVAEK